MIDSESLEFFKNLDTESQEKLYKRAMDLCLAKEPSVGVDFSFYQARSIFMKNMIRVVLLERAHRRFVEWSKNEDIVEHLKKIEKEKLEQEQSI